VNEEFYISLAGEIFDGYTEFQFKGRSVYLKHLTIKDQRNIHLYYDKYKNIATSRGVETEEEILQKVKDDGLWTDEDDLKISSLSSEIKNLKKTKDSLFLNSQKEGVKNTITEKQKEHFRLLYKRKEIVGKTAEDYASSMASTEMIRYFVFDSKDLDKHAFSKEEFDEMDDLELIALKSLQSEFDEMDDLELIALKSLQSEITEKISEKHIQEAVLRPFFSLYLSFCENARDFFGKPLVDLSVYQLKMVVFGRVFQSIFQNIEDIPDDIRDDPDRLLAFADAKQNRGKGGSKAFIDDNAAASTVFGGTADDIKDLNQSGGKTVSLSEEIKKSGGTLNMEQMMKLAGQ
jgi:hypothetical protein